MLAGNGINQSTVFKYAGLNVNGHKKRAAIWIRKRHSEGPFSADRVRTASTCTAVLRLGGEIHYENQDEIQFLILQ
jgi:hypothetical protein